MGVLYFSHGVALQSSPLPGLLQELGAPPHTFFPAPSVCSCLHSPRSWLPVSSLCLTLSIPSWTWGGVQDPMHHRRTLGVPQVHWYWQEKKFLRCPKLKLQQPRERESITHRSGISDPFLRCFIFWKTSSKEVPQHWYLVKKSESFAFWAASYYRLDLKFLSSCGNSSSAHHIKLTSFKFSESKDDISFASWFHNI